MNPLKKLFEPLSIGDLELKNRLELSPIGTGYCTNMRVTDRLKNFFLERAKGGVGLIGISCSVTRLEDDAPVPGIYSDEFVSGLRDLVDIIHAQDAKVFCQLISAYGWAFGPGPVEWVSPSGITVHGSTRPPVHVGLTPSGPQPRALTVAEIHHMIGEIGEGARRARDAGFDAIEILASTGYTFSQFFSPLTNKRTDEYGGSLENRMRFFLEAVDSIKKKAGNDCIIRFCVSPQHTEGGYSMDELKKLASALARAGVHGFSFRTGWHDDRIEMLQNSVPQGAWVWIAEELKKVVDVPVSAGSRISDPQVAEKVIAEARADQVYMARALIVDPDLPNKAREGRFDEIRPCIGCMHCFDGIGTAFSCTVNPRAGREEAFTVQPTREAKKVLVIGGGPAGMEAARTAALRMHQVTLCEKKDELGGQLLLAALPPHKDSLKKLTSYLINQLEDNKVEIRLGHEADLKLIEKINPDVVILATGAMPIFPDIPGIKEKNVFTALDVLEGNKGIGEEIVIIGGGMIGCETAEFLAARGKKVAIVEMMDRIGNDIGPATRRGILLRLRKNKVRIETKVTVEEISHNGVRVLRNGLSEFIESDSVVLAAGMKPDRTLGKALEEKGYTFHLIGDCVAASMIIGAIKDGFQVAIEI